MYLAFGYVFRLLLGLRHNLALLIPLPNRLRSVLSLVLIFGDTLCPTSILTAL